ncbi:hypothetical protein CB0940_06716 [Cercospora beticola]|uniref:DUF4385 multi-domain protein n=1 Tax=Cercospora beticola TaxID=122368 RepID=A0A2G5H993_CERBT|nr:hypothetical protein CB0940_06716 [Cercospora beticola]PIA89104.1 hypothetical protein CB0940_06716 [Cercospora beticola]WPB02616.1 hypothetical protein RHO25_007252 [Cercospora beticola]
MPRTRTSAIPSSPPSTKSPSPPHKSVRDLFPTPALHDEHIRMSYEIARGEQGVLTFEPYKSILLPHWRFRTVPVAEESSKTLKGAFDHYVQEGDLVGSDMARKFIQMGMTRAKRYANHAGGKKYAKSSLQLEREAAALTGDPVKNPNHSHIKRTELPKSTGHAGQEEKLAASEIFKVLWKECMKDEGYLRLKEQWQKEKKEWMKAGGKVKKEEGIWKGYEAEGGRGRNRKKAIKEEAKDKSGQEEHIKKEVVDD